MNAPNSRELFQLFQTGNSQAAGEIYDRYVFRLIGLVRQRLSAKLARRIDPEDVVQSAYRSFFVHAGNDQYVLNRAGDLWRLLVGITLNKLHGQIEQHTAARRNIAREEPATSAGHEIGEPIEPRALPEEEVAILEQVELVMRRLPPLATKVLEMRLRGEAVEEIGQAINRSQRTVRRLLDSIRHSLEAELINQHSNPRPDVD